MTTLTQADVEASGNRRGDSRIAPTTRKSLGRLVGAFKTVTTKQINLAEGTPGQLLWQRNYYERVIRNVDEMNRIRQYIASNPLLWETDKENPNAACNNPCRGGSRTAHPYRGCLPI